MRKLYTATFIFLLTICLNAQVASTASIAESSTLLCTNMPLELYAIPSGTNSTLTYTWSISPNRGFNPITNFNSPTLSVTFTNSSAYTINLNSSDGSTTNLFQKILTINRSAKASFNATFKEVGYPTQLVLTNYSGGFLKSYWRFNDATEPDTLLNTSREYTAPGSYSVTLYTTGVNSCNDSSTYAFTISDVSSIILPNIFTPNGDDVNDVFRPTTVGIKTLKAWVYNRYGNLIASWDKVRGSWDGHTISGEECSEGTYAVVVEALGFDGKEYKLKGFITLAR